MESCLRMERLIDLYTAIVYNLYIHIANRRQSAEAVETGEFHDDA